MRPNPRAIFLVNLVQDVNVLRPLVFMATKTFGFDALILISSKFFGRDAYGIWNAEIDQICRETNATRESFDDDWDACRHLTGEGILFAASESFLAAHETTHNIFKFAPAGFLKVTLQHGFECIGFRHSVEHIKAHGATAAFGADVVCAWTAPSSLYSMAQSQRGKLHVTGPSSILQLRTDAIMRASDAPGIVCENLHSVRLNVSGDFKREFVDTFGTFCDLVAHDRGKVVLRPHPGGQYALKNGLKLPSNASINNAPMYRLDLRTFAYGISAPSSVLIDMLFANIPTAVWRDHSGTIDIDNYDGLTTISTPQEWLEFSREARADPESFLKLQSRFLDNQQMPLRQEDVFRRFAEIFRMAARREVRPAGAGAVERDRILFVANANVPTLQLSFEKPLAPLVNRGELTVELLTEPEILAQRRHEGGEDEWLDTYLSTFNPAIIIFCRYSGPAAGRILEWATRRDVPVLYHIDDDLLAIPSDIGEKKFAMHNAPDRIATVRQLLTGSDLVYASTPKLRAQLLKYYADLSVVAGKIYCSSSVMRRPVERPARKIGYMASADHAHNLDMILPAIINILDKNPHVVFELFGSIPIPAALQRFGERITTARPIANYNAFLQEFATYEWDVGICPLTSIHFNLMKANTKWVEYTATGAAVVASRNTVYDECCADDCGLLASTVEEWEDALHLLVNDDKARTAMIRSAQNKLEREYGIGNLREQVIQMIDTCRSNFATAQTPA